MLGPAPLGNYGLAFLAIAVAEVFTETGINIVLLKNPKKLTQYIHVAWLVSIVRGGVISLILGLSAHWLSGYYHSPALFGLLLWASLIPLTRGFINPAIISFRQNLEFEKEAALRTFLQAFDVIVGFLLVFVFHDVVGLVWGTGLAAVLEVILSFALFRTWPQPWLAQWKLVPALYHETKFVIGSGILQYLSENLDNIMVGKILGPAGLGLYQSAYKLASTLTIDLGSLIGQVMYPIFARIVHAKESVSHLLVTTQLAMTIVFLILAIPLYAFTQQMVLLILGPQWLEVIPTVRWLYIACALKSSLSVWNTLSILGENLKHYVAINGLMTAVMAGAILVLAPRFGVQGAGMAVFLSVIVIFPYAVVVLQKALQRLPSR
jgi:O-antigen/teichoic acid export membrane protein